MTLEKMHLQSRIIRMTRDALQNMEHVYSTLGYLLLAERRALQWQDKTMVKFIRRRMARITNAYRAQQYGVSDVL